MSTELEYGGGMLTALFQSLWSALYVCLFVHEHSASWTGGIGTRNNSVGIEQAFMGFGFGNVLGTELIAGTDNSETEDEDKDEDNEDGNDNIVKKRRVLDVCRKLRFKQLNGLPILSSGSNFVWSGIDHVQARGKHPGCFGSPCLFNWLLTQTQKRLQKRL